MTFDWQGILIMVFFIIFVSIQFSLNRIIVLLKEIDKSLKRISKDNHITREG